MPKALDSLVLEKIFFYVVLQLLLLLVHLTRLFFKHL